MEAGVAGSPVLTNKHSSRYIPLPTVQILYSVYLLNQCCSFKILNGFLKVLLLKVVGSQPCSHADVTGEVPERLGQEQTKARPTPRSKKWFSQNRKCSFYLCVMVQSLRLIPLILKQLPQFGQHATVGGAHTDDVHQPLNRLLRIFQKLIYGARELRAVVNGHGTVADPLVVSQDTGWPTGTWPLHCSSGWNDASKSSPQPPPVYSASCRLILGRTGREMDGMIGYTLIGLVHHSNKAEWTVPRL